MQSAAEKFAGFVVDLWRLKQAQAGPEKVGAVLADIAQLEVPAEGEISVTHVATRYVSENEAAQRA